MRETCLELYITRHGESLGNLPEEDEEAKLLTSELRANPPLSRLGEQQVILLGERLAGLQFDAIFTSPLQRAAHTAYATACRQPDAATVEIIPDLVEIGTHTPADGFPIAALQKQYPGLVLCKDAPALGVCFTQEEEEEAQRLLRAQRCIAYLRKRFHAGEDIFICAHGTFNTYLIRAALQLSNENSFRYSQANTGLTKIKYYYDGRVCLSYMNDTTHLAALQEGLRFRL